MYRVLVSRRAEKELQTLPKATQARITTALAELSGNPRPDGVKKLKGTDGYRIRVGDYRVIYDIDDEIKIVSIERIRHRKEAYD